MSEYKQPDWQDTWIDFARLISKRSHDPRRKVGAVIVTSDNTQVLSIGYNGDWKGGPNKPVSLEPGESGFIHAEANALIKLDYNNPKEKHLYVTSSPCIDCARLIINAGIKRVIYDEQYRNIDGIELLKRANVTVFSIHELAI